MVCRPSKIVSMGGWKLKGWKFVTVVIVGSLVLLTLLFLVSPVFYIEDIVIQGNARVTTTEIRERLGLSGTSNILLLNTNAARSRVMGNLYIGEVTFRRDLPRRLYVTVSERRLSAYVEHTPGTILILDEEGRVLGTRAQPVEQLPILEGVQFTRFQLGEILEVQNATDFANIVLYAQLLITHDLIHKITNINVSDPSNIRILVNYMEFHVGGISDADEKVRTIAAMLAQTDEYGTMRGYVDMRTRRTEYFFVLLQ